MSVFIPEDPSQALVSHNHLTLSTVAVHHFTFPRASIQHDSCPRAGGRDESRGDAWWDRWRAWLGPGWVIEEPSCPFKKVHVCFQPPHGDALGSYRGQSSVRCRGVACLCPGQLSFQLTLTLISNLVKITAQNDKVQANPVSAIRHLRILSSSSSLYY